MLLRKKAASYMLIVFVQQVIRCFRLSTYQILLSL